MDFSASNIVDYIAEYQQYPAVSWFIEQTLRGVQRFPIIISDFEGSEGTENNPIIVEDCLGDKNNPIVID